MRSTFYLHSGTDRNDVVELEKDPPFSYTLFSMKVGMAGHVDLPIHSIDVLAPCHVLSIAFSTSDEGFR